ncbi:hypothetical protein ASC76_06305 [Rhizobacter sp. Root404]|nr:hypothetical protein ASC76_06305 [Rhizobacter sp. Root404]
MTALHSAARTLRWLARQVWRLADAWRLRREAQATYLALRSLDNRVLRDLAIDRSELLSIALAPVGGERLRGHA